MHEQKALNHPYILRIFKCVVAPPDDTAYEILNMMRPEGVPKNAPIFYCLMEIFESDVEAQVKG